MDHDGGEQRASSKQKHYTLYYQSDHTNVANSSQRDPQRKHVRRVAGIAHDYMLSVPLHATKHTTVARAIASPLWYEIIRHIERSRYRRATRALEGERAL